MIFPRRLLAFILKRKNVWNAVPKYLRTIKKRENTQQRIVFITKCRNADIIPRFLRFRIPTNGCFEPTVVHNFQRKLLNLELESAKVLLKEHNLAVENYRREICDTVPAAFIPSIVFNMHLTIHTTRAETKQRHSNKLQRLSSEQERPLFDVQNTVKLHNLDVTPPKYVMDTLALGPRSAVISQFSQQEVLAELDLMLSRCENENVPHEVVNDINIAVVKYIKQCNKQKVPRNLKLTKLFLKKNMH